MIGEQNHYKYLRFNRINSVEHVNFDNYPNTKATNLAETFFHAYGQSLELCTYSNTYKNYTLRHEGAKILSSKRIKDTLSSPPTHEIEFEWNIISSTGFVEILINGVSATVRWGGGKITDLNGQEADLVYYDISKTFGIEESLTLEEKERLEAVNNLYNEARQQPLELKLKTISRMTEMLNKN